MLSRFPAEFAFGCRSLRLSFVRRLNPYNPYNADGPDRIESHIPAERPEAVVQGRNGSQRIKSAVSRSSSDFKKGRYAGCLRFRLFGS